MFICLLGLLIFFFRCSQNQLFSSRLNFLNRNTSAGPFESNFQNNSESNFQKNSENYLTNLSQSSPQKNFPQAKLSIIVPVRNEALRLTPLLESLKGFSHLNTEAIFVDDESTDLTVQKIENYKELMIRKLYSERTKKEFSSDERTMEPLAIPITVVRSQTKPDDWVGKSWACYQGAQQATGDYLLFTDADTVLLSNAIEDVLQVVQKLNLDLISALPFHQCHTWWEKCLGPFHLLSMAIVQGFNPSLFKKPRKYTYAIGQFLLFKKTAYFQSGSHEAVKTEAGEDIALVKNLLSQKMRYLIWNQSPLYHVRMFATFKEFWLGWLRLYGIGLKLAPFRLNVEAVLMQYGWFSIFHFSKSPIYLFFGFTLVCYLAWRQKVLGQFSVLGALLFPLSQLLFVSLSLNALFLLILRKGRVEWRGRRIKA